MPDSPLFSLAEPDRARLHRRIDACVDPVRVRAIFEELDAKWGVLPRPEGDALLELVPVFDHCRFLALKACSRPELVANWAGADRTRPLGHGEFAAMLAERVAGIEDPVEFDALLRRFKYEQYLRLSARDLNGHASTRGLCEEISDLAEACIDAAWHFHEGLLCAQWGTPMHEGGPCRFVILGMGKLGGRELNYSSDVDLVFLYEGDGETTGGERNSTNAEYFARLGRAIIKSLNEMTADGFVVRVDMRLRPGGQYGPIAHGAEVAEEYFLNWGQTWERAALIKARPVGGNRDLGDEFCHAIRPWVYRRTLDYTTMDDVVEMKDKIDTHVASLAANRSGWDVKLGRGGIREIEFLAQAMQLVFAGHRQDLRRRSTVETMHALVNLEKLSADESAGLVDAYWFLRTLEHRIQMIDERQTQLLPDRDEAMAAIAAAMPPDMLDARSAQGLRDALAVHRERVREVFDRFLRDRQRERTRPPADSRAMRLCRLVLEDAEHAEDMALPDVEALRDWGLGELDEVLPIVERMRRQLAFTHIPGRARAYMREILPHMFESLLESSQPARALFHFDRLLAALGGHTEYYGILAENPPILRRLAILFASSEYLSNLLLKHPELLDRLVLGGDEEEAFDPENLQARLENLLEEVRDDEEEILDILRRFNHEETLRIGLADLGGELDPETVARWLTHLAEACLRVACRVSCNLLCRRFRLEIKGMQNPEAADGMAVIVMGKVGNFETSYSSDLDLIFVFDTPRESEEPAPDDDERRPLSPADFYTRLGQKLITVLSIQTREGVVYEIDTRLRPSGNQGPLVTSKDQFIAYQNGKAQTWERQSLLKARAVAGNRTLGAELVDEYLPSVLFEKSVDRAALAEDMLSMRERIEAELAPPRPDRYNIKFGKGGLVDVEFIVQFHQLVEGGARPMLRRGTTRGLLQAIRDEGLIDEATWRVLRDRYQFLHRLSGRLRIVHNQSKDDIRLDDDGRLAQLARQMGYPVQETAVLARQFREELLNPAEEVRSIMERLIRG